jgi:ADP-ribosyl-[dinitrogen reductase] hydrolase
LPGPGSDGTTPLKNRVLGSLLGGALGDAWGGPSEGALGITPFKIPVQPVLSDDTQLTLATCESIIESGRADPESIAIHLLRWYRAGGVRGIGSSTLKAMRDLAVGTHWAISGARGEFAAGNGAAMRIAPLAFLLNPTNSEDRIVIRDVCRITHHSDEAYVGALAVVLAIRSVLSGDWSQYQSFLAATVDNLPDSAVRDRIQSLLPLKVPASEVALSFGATGHVVDTVPLALYCAQSIAFEPLPAVLALAIGVGGDTDTIASIAGQLAGTVVGSAGIPHELFAAVEGGEEVADIAEAFSEFVAKNKTKIRSPQLGG